MQYVRETTQGKATSSEKRKKTSCHETLEKLSSTEDEEESQAEKSPIDSSDVRDEGVDNALKALGINAKAKARTARKKSGGKRKRRRVDDDERERGAEEQEVFRQFVEKSDQQSDKLVAIVENMNRNQRKQTEVMTNFLSVINNNKL